MNKQDIIQACVVFIFISIAVFVTLNQTEPPNALPVSAPTTEFSAERSIEHIKIIAQGIRIPGTPEYAIPRDYVMGELTAMGLNSEIQRTTCSMPEDFQAYLGWTNVPTVEVENIISRIEGTSTQEAILLVAHLDTTPYGPGATDDGSGVAVLLETARALLSGSPLRNSIILLFTGPEETGSFGAVAFIKEHPWIEDVKLVINVDAGGLTGPSELTSTSPDNGWLIHELARADSYVYGSSSSGEGASDFVPFKYYGFSGYAFDFSWDRRIHTPYDNVENLNPSSIQHQGHHTLSLTKHFGNLESLEDPKDPSPIFFNVLRLGFVNYSTVWVIPITLVVVLIFVGVVALGFRRNILTRSGIGLGVLTFLVSLISAPLIVSILWIVLSSTVSAYQVNYLGHAPNEQLLLALFFSVALALSNTLYVLIQRFRQVSVPDLTIGAYAILTVATVVFSVVMPESSFASAWPGFFSFLAVGYWFYSLSDDIESVSIEQLVVLILGALIPIALILQVSIASFMSSEANDWFLPIGFFVMLLGLLVPQMQIISRPNKWWLPVSTWVVTALLLVTVLIV